MPLAEKLMHPELIQPTLRSRKAIYAGDLAILGHEYVHSQGFLGIDRKLWFGCSLEERRADFFSGKDSYYMVTEFFHNLRLATGFDLNTYYANAPKGGTIAELSTALAKNLGLRTMLEILLRPPGNYLRDQSNTYQQFCTQYTGNYNDIVNAAVLSEVQQGRETSIADRCRYLVQMALPRIAECPDKFPTFLQYENGLSEGLARIVFNAALELRTAHAL